MPVPCGMVPAVPVAAGRQSDFGPLANEHLKRGPDSAFLSSEECLAKVSAVSWMILSRVA
jgi:hypothetical protein